MVKKILCILIALLIISVTGCSLVSKAQVSSTTTPASISTVREAKIGKVWMMKQIEIDLAAEVPIVLKLKEGDQVEGYFYLVKGDNVGFSISGSSPIYTSKATDTETMRITSDRFAFTASQAQGIAYTLTLNPGSGTNGKVATTVFLELIYPASATLLVPIGTK
jgi:hypothetical protein